MFADPSCESIFSVMVEQPIHLSPGAALQYSFNDHARILFGVHVGEIIFREKPLACLRQLIGSYFYGHLQSSTPSLIPKHTAIWSSVRPLVNLFSPRHSYSSFICGWFLIFQTPE